MRFINRLLGAVVALALIVTAVLVVIEVCAAGFNASPVLVHWHAALDWARRTTWDASAVQAACLIMAAVGLVLTVLELKPRRRRRFTMRSEATDTAITRRGLKAAMQTAVGDVDGVDSTAVTVRRRRIRVHASSSAAQPDTAQTIDSSVQSAAQSRLGSLELEPAPKVVTKVSTRSQ